MAKQCFTNRTIERYLGTINRVKRQYITVSERSKENSKDISQLVKNLTAVDATVDAPNEALRPGPKTLNEKSTEEFVRDVLARARKPLTIPEIFSRVEQLGWTAANPLTKYQYISNALRRGHQFRCVARGKYILNR